MADTVEWGDPDAEKALAEHYGQVRLERAICDGQKGYRVTYSTGVRAFHFRLATAIRDMLQALGHGEDRDVLVVGEPEVGNAWRVSRTEPAK